MEEWVEKEIEKGHLAAEWKGEVTTLVSRGQAQCDLTPTQGPLGWPWPQELSWWLT